MSYAITRRALLGAAGVSVAAAKPRGNALSHTKGEKVAFLSGGRPLFEYRYAAARPKTYVHPLCAPNGAPVTIDGPPDHIHHRGVMLAWSDIQGFDFWGEDNPGPPHGRIVHQHFESIREKPAPEITGVNHWLANDELVLIERRTVRAPEQGADLVRLEWESELRPAARAVTLSALNHPYDGLGIRFVHSMDGGTVLNSNGAATIEQANGDPARWAAYCGALEPAAACCVAVFDHPRNPRHPSPFFVMNKPFGYLSAAPTFREPLRIEAGGSIGFRWAIVIYSGAPERARLDRLYQGWLEERRP